MYIEEVIAELRKHPDRLYISNNLIIGNDCGTIRYWSYRLKRFVGVFDKVEMRLVWERFFIEDYKLILR